MRLIDADALKDTICSNVYPVTDYFNSRDYGMFWTGGIEKAIDEQPTIESAHPERTGRWIEENPQDSPDCRLIKCSECGDTYIVNMSIDYADWIQGRNFCRQCGADLRGGTNGKDT